MGFSIATALFLVALAGAIQTATINERDVRMVPRGVRGGEGDDTVVVEAAQGARQQSCRRDEQFLDCGPACPRTCLSIRSPRACPNTCSVGCFCREGLVRDYSGRCIRASQCP